MRPLLFLALAGACLMPSCYKDDLDLALLTTNPVDPDYTGPALIELESDSTVPYFDGGTQQMEAYVRQTVHVRADLLPPGADYSLYLVKLNTGEVFDYSSPIPPGDPIYYQVQLGEDYCYEYRLKVEHALTKAYTYCTTAEL